jgi:hypothetical protein
MREEDEKKKQAVTVKNEAESFIHVVDKQVSDLGVRYLDLGNDI